MKNNLIKLQSLLLFAYISVLIIFKMNYTIIIHIIDLLLILNFVFILLISKDQNIKVNNIIKYFSMFVFVAAFSSFWAEDFYNTVFKATQLFILLLNLVVIYNSVMKFNLLNSLLYGILFGAFFNYLLALEILYVPFETTTKYGYRFFGTVGNANVLAILMLISMLVSMIYIIGGRLKNKFGYIYHYINILLATYIILLTASKKGFIFGLLLILFYLILTVKNPKYFFKTVITLFLALLIVAYFIDIQPIIDALDNTLKRFMAFEEQLSANTHFGSTGERKFFITYGLDLFMNKPLLGYGLNSFMLLNPVGLYSHNNYIELMVGTGILGLLTFYMLHFSLIKSIIKMKHENLRSILLFFVAILLIMDNALVSYNDKFMIYTLLILSIVASNKNHGFKIEKDSK